MSNVTIGGGIRGFAKKLREVKVSAFAYRGVWPSLLLALSAWAPLVMAQDGHAHATPPQQELTAEQKSQQSALIKIVREATERFKDVAQAEREGYALSFGCVSGPDQGAMGLHFINSGLVMKGAIDPTAPQIILYEPTEDGRLKLTGADFLVDAQQWDEDKTHKPGPPELMGQLFHYFESPNRFGLKAFYTLHVWAWKENPNGAFVNWHPAVACKLFNGPTS
ncbi:MAG TPA: hypothetical protein VLC94_09515 [Candidatus Acidoferrum sp.]|nr:hypothetical protein [Candidatus Acidoferrum sp.]